ncbi:helix-turn-helix domain-containing protein, partial [Vibrio sp. D173a]|uniref:helix-turn-helix domain-containing protein n=1 Tax=Vibrio sp. D173a TaxID=2836349 RepID=UPI002555F961
LSCQRGLAAAMARDDYETRRKRQAQGIEKAKALGKYQGRKPDLRLRENIQLLLAEGKSWSQVQELLGCSRSTIATVKKLTATSKSNSQNSIITN